MKIGTVIKTHRKRCGLTQEEMANRLGVTASAVNKWENGASLPDVTMLSPIARLLGITVDTLLSFRETLTEEELQEKMEYLWGLLNGGSYAEAFSWSKNTAAEYPNCCKLLLWMAQALEAYFVVMPDHASAEADAFMEDCYERAVSCEEESIRIGAADALFHRAVRMEDYDRAETYLQYFSMENPERKRKQALLHGKRGQVEDACRAYEELLFVQLQNVRMVLQNLYTLAMQQGDAEWAQLIVEKHGEAVKLYDAGEYAAQAAILEYAMDMKDTELTLKALKGVLDHADTLDAFTRSPLYRHMTFKTMENDFGEQLRCKLKCEFQKDTRLDFLRDDPRLKEILT